MRLIFPNFCISRSLVVSSPLLLACSAFLLAAPASAQEQERTEQYVGQFLVYSGFMNLNSPHISLSEPGIHIQTGMRWSRHISMGFDYSRGTGDTTIGLDLATPALQNYIKPLLAQAIAAGALPPNYVAALKFSSVTQTFAAGPEFPYRRFKRFTPYIRPSVGLIAETATAHPADLITKLLVKQIAPTGQESMSTLFYGVGGGIAFNITKHFSLVTQVDFVHDHLFPDLLKDGRNSIRLSIGPGVQFGNNVTRRWGIPGHWN